MASKLPPHFLARLEAVTARRARTLIDHILTHGHVSTEEFTELYGYNHPPRAARDVRELGIPLETFKVTASDGRRIGAYRFGDPKDLRLGLSGRRQWPTGFRKQLEARYGSRCGICGLVHNSTQMQIDHRIPFQVGGDTEGELDVEDFMLLCRSCNRAKSWSCEHCRNWTTDHLLDVCRNCYWASPEDYEHIALELIRRLDIVWQSEEVSDHERLAALAAQAQRDLPDFVKDVLQGATGRVHDADETAGKR